MDKQDWKHFKKSFKENWFGWLLQIFIVVMFFGLFGYLVYSRFTNPQPVNINDEDVELIMSNTVF